MLLTVLALYFEHETEINIVKRRKRNRLAIKHFTIVGKNIKHRMLFKIEYFLKSSNYFVPEIP